MSVVHGGPSFSSSLFRWGMFHRRLVAIAAVIVLAFTAIGARLASLTVREGDEHRAEAESRLGRSRLLPTIRGRILDRTGRVLAEDVPAYGVAIEYAAIDGTWLREEAKRLAKEELGRSAWSALSRRAREAATESRIPAARRRLDALLDDVAQISGVPRDELSARIDRIRDEVSKQAEVVRARQEAAFVARYGDAARDRFTPDPIREERSAHAIVPEVSDPVAFALRRVAEETPGAIEVTDSVRRIYPWSTARVLVDRAHFPGPLRTTSAISVDLDGVADHLVGRCRNDVWEEDLERRPFLRADGEEDLGGYRPGADLVGQSGIERSQEDVLRGARGRITTRLDSGHEERVDAVAGRDVTLTIDAALQARVEAILDPRAGLTVRHAWQDGAAGEDELHAVGLAEGMPLASAVVIVEVDTGEIVACASWPSRAEAGRLTNAESARLQPFVHRAVEGIYSPGSILKPLVYLAAVTEGVFPVDGEVVCTGHYFPDHLDVARCWIYRPRYGMATHSDRAGGALGAEAALARSCNIFFYTLGHKLGPERLTAWMRRFGLGAPLGIGLAREVSAKDGSLRVVGESAGALPSESVIRSVEERRDAFTPIFLAIGQGPIAWTPVQAANAYATIAREGVIRDATLVRAGAGGRVGAHGASLRANLEFSSRAVDHMIEGLRLAVEAPYGTAHHITFGEAREPVFAIDGVRVHGKTGTAQAPPLKLDGDGDGTPERTITGLDHAWFAGLVGDSTRARPRYAVAAIVEYGGSGGKVAGPVAAEAIRALVAEGYLAPGDTSSGRGGGGE